MKYINFKKIALATVLLTSTANAYFDQDSLKSWSDQDLKHTGLKLADKVLSNTGNRDYNFLKLAVLSQEETSRGMNPTFAANPEDKLTFGVYEYLATKANMNSKVFEAFFTFFDEKAFTLSSFNLFMEKTGIQAKTAPTPSHKKTQVINKESGVDSTPLIKNREYVDPRANYLSINFGTNNGKLIEPALIPDDKLEKVFEHSTNNPTQNESMEDTNLNNAVNVSPMEIEISKSGSNSPKSEISESKQEEILSEDSGIEQNPINKVDVDAREFYLKNKGWSLDPAYIPDRFLEVRLVQEFGEQDTEFLLNGPTQSVSLEEKKAVTLEEKKDAPSELEVVIESSKKPLLTDVRKSRATMKNKRPPTLKREKKGETTQETPVVTTPMEVEVEKPETKVVETPVRKSITPPLPMESENVKHQEEKKVDIVSPQEDAAPTEQELKLRRLSKMGVNMMGGFNPGAVQLKKVPLKQ